MIDQLSEIQQNRMRYVWLKKGDKPRVKPYLVKTALQSLALSILEVSLILWGTYYGGPAHLVTVVVVLIWFETLLYLIAEIFHSIVTSPALAQDDYILRWQCLTDVYNPYARVKRCVFMSLHIIVLILVALTGREVQSAALIVLSLVGMIARSISNDNVRSYVAAIDPPEVEDGSDESNIH